jgi:ferredoxin-NADP reductase
MPKTYSEDYPLYAFPYVHLIAKNGSTTEGPYYTGLLGVNVLRDKQLVSVMGMTIASIIALVLLIRGWDLFVSHLRHIYCLTANKAQQNYWSFDRSRIWPWLKKNLIYAPIGTKRHNREIQLSNAHNYGTLPGRLHLILLVSYGIANIIFCLWLDYNHNDLGRTLAELRGRSGILSVANMIPIIIFAARNNPLSGLLKISFDTFNLFHRWLGRIAIIEAVVHTMAWWCAYNQAEGAEAAAKSFTSNPFLQYGLVSIVMMSIILILSLSPIRHAFYETFLTGHQIMAFIVLLGVYQHLDIPKLPALPYIRAVVVIWTLERFTRFCRLLYLNVDRRRGATSLVIEALSGDATRLTFQLPRQVTIRPGSHVYVILPKISLWQSHPFSVAWTNIESEPPTGRQTEGPHILPGTPNSLEKQTMAPSFRASSAPTSISLVVAKRSGFTKTIHDRARSAPDRIIKTSGYVEGPYAGHERMDSYGTVFMFAGGAGITHHLIQIRYILAGAAAKTVATRKIVLVWTVKDPQHFTWVSKWMDEVMRMPERRDILKILLYVTKPRSDGDYESPHGTIRTHTGRCQPGTVLDAELPARVGATMVSVCGPGALADEVRAAVRARLELACIDMNEESFTW